mmetsp:Transcript_9115/g.19234  ORF Transcript_9115/g.19234 Transcript_9115/m.19234 type:complete len:108 (+) Transcript_9115:145-468(+)
MGRLSLFTGPTADMSEDEKMKLLRMKKKKKDFDFMTCSVLKEQQKHLLASLHFKARPRLLYARYCCFWTTPLQLWHTRNYAYSRPGLTSSYFCKIISQKHCIPSCLI